MQVKQILLIYVLWESQRKKLWQWVSYTHHRDFFLLSHFSHPSETEQKSTNFLHSPWPKVNVRGKIKQKQFRFELPFAAEGEAKSFSTYWSETNLTLLGWECANESSQAHRNGAHTNEANLQLKEQVRVLSFNCRGKADGSHAICSWFSSISEFISFYPALCSLKLFSCIKVFSLVSKLLRDNRGRNIYVSATPYSSQVLARRTQKWPVPLLPYSQHGLNFYIKVPFIKLIKVITLAQEIEDVNKRAGWKNSMQIVFSHSVLFRGNRFHFFFNVKWYHLGQNCVVWCCT